MNPQSGILEYLMFKKTKTYWGVSPVIINVVSQKQMTLEEQIKNSWEKRRGDHHACFSYHTCFPYRTDFPALSCRVY